MTSAVAPVRFGDEGGEVDVEDVGFDDFDVGVVAEAEAEFGGEGGVDSMAMRRRQRGARMLVMAPWPGPISMTVRVERSPRASAMAWRAGSSVRKFWPSFGLRGMG